MTKPDLRNADPATSWPRSMAAMRNWSFLKSPKYQDQQMRAERIGAHPLILEFADKMVKRCAAFGIPVFPHTIVRTREDQAAAFALGHSKLAGFAPFPHQHFAVDIIHGVLAWDGVSAIPHAWDVLGHIGRQTADAMQIDITWGGTFKRLYDPAHWEITNWREILVTGDKQWSPDHQALA